MTTVLSVQYFELFINIFVLKTQNKSEKKKGFLFQSKHQKMRTTYFRDVNS